VFSLRKILIDIDPSNLAVPLDPPFSRNRFARANSRGRKVFPDFASLRFIRATITLHIKKGGGALIDATVRVPRRANRCCHLFALGAWARYGRARLPALRRGSCIGERTPPLSPRPRFLGLG
jgi:hypothetical protein